MLRWIVRPARPGVEEATDGGAANTPDRRTVEGAEPTVTGLSSADRVTRLSLRPTGRPADTAEVPVPLLTAVLVVRDEEDQISACLAGLTGVVDEVLVHDAGSTDGTAELARLFGATVLDGTAADGPAAARNAAADVAGGRWLLLVGADEQVQGDVPALRAWLEADARSEAFNVLVQGPEDGLAAGGVHWAARIVRRDAVRWAGGDRAVTISGGSPRTGTMPAHLCTVEHRGYADPDLPRRRAERDAEQAQGELDALAAAGAGADGVAPVLLRLGRSLMTAGRTQDAVDTFETLRDLAPGTAQWAEATDLLARMLLAAGHDEAVVLLSDQLREAGGDRRYSDWLRAQALAQLGAPGEALQLVRAIDDLVDPGGRRHDLGHVLEVHALLAALLGHREEALGALARAMAHHGRVAGRGPMLLDLWGADDPPAGLADLVRRCGSGHLAAVARELRAAGGAGPQVASALGS